MALSVIKYPVTPTSSLAVKLMPEIVVLSAVVGIVNVSTIGSEVSEIVIVTLSVATLLTLSASSRAQAYSVTSVGIAGRIVC